MTQCSQSSMDQSFGSGSNPLPSPVKSTEFASVKTQALPASLTYPQPAATPLARISSPLQHQDSQLDSPSAAMSANDIVHEASVSTTCSSPGESHSSPAVACVVANDEPNEVSMDDLRCEVLPSMREENDHEGAVKYLSEADRKAGIHLRDGYPRGGPFSQASMDVDAGDRQDPPAEHKRSSSNVNELGTTSIHSASGSTTRYLEANSEMHIDMSAMELEITQLIATDVRPEVHVTLLKLKDSLYEAIADARQWKLTAQDQTRRIRELEIEKSAALRNAQSCATETAAALAVSDAATIRINALTTQLQETLAKLSDEDVRRAHAEEQHAKREKLLEDAWAKLKVLARGEEASRLRALEAEARSQRSAEQVATLTKACDDLKSEVLQSRAKLHLLEGSLGHAMNKNDDLSAEVSHLTSQVRCMELVKESQRSRLQEMEKGLRREAQLLIDALAEISKRSKSEADLMSERTLLKSTVDSLQSKIQMLQEDLRVKTESIAMMEVSLEEEMYRRHSLTQHLSDSRSICTQLEAQLSKANTLCDHLQMCKIDLESRNQELSSALEQHQQKASELDADLNRHKDLIAFINKLSAESEALKKK